MCFAGATSDPYAFYKSADFFVLPTKHDPCSLVVLEALAMGVPVISTVFNGACEIMRGGKAGVVLDDPADLSALAAAMESMLDSGRRKQWSSEGLALRSALSQKTHVDELQQVYRTIAAKMPV